MTDADILWVAVRHLDDYQSAVVAAIRGRWDIDTNAAIDGETVAPSLEICLLPRPAAEERAAPLPWRKGHQRGDLRG